MKEIACLFGPNEHLSGIVTEPATCGNEALILVSAGIVPKYGPYRLYAELSRAVAATGRVVLRFDLGGIGDSVLGTEQGGLRARTAAEIQQAIDFMVERYGVKRITVGGLCSGAEDALRAAACDRRVTGVLLIDPFAYRTKGWLWRHMLFRSIRRLLRVAGVYEPRRGLGSAEGSDRSRVVVYEYMNQAESRQLLERLVHREVKIHCIYTGGMREIFNHTDQFFKMYPGVLFKGFLVVDFISDIDHTAPCAEDRMLIIKRVLSNTSA